MRSKKALYNLISNLLLQAIIIISGFIVPRIIISSFGSEVNGLVSSITQFLAYITLLESGFGPVIKAALYKPIANKDSTTIGNILKSSEKIFRVIALIFLGYIVILCAFYPFIVNNQFDWLFTSSLIVIIGISTFAEYYFGMTFGLFLQAKQRKYVISFIQIITYILSTIAIIVLARIRVGIHIIKLVSGAIFIIRPLFLNIYVKRKFNLDLKNCAKDYKLNKKWDGLAQHVAYVIHTKTDVTVLTLFTTLSEVSVYSVYHLVVSGVKALIGTFSGSLDATFGDMIAKSEEKNLNEKFSVFETIFNTVSTIAFSTAIVLITPFISVYTRGITDVDYIRPLFGVLLVISEYIWAVRQPYNVIILAAGHFKETRKGAWVECISNIVISIILVNWLGIIGVAIGTIVAMAIRAIEFIYHANKYILRRSIWKSGKKIALIVLETAIIVAISSMVQFRENNNYLDFGINLASTMCVASIITLTINSIFFGKELNGAIRLFSKALLKRKSKRKIDERG
ncbi:polysaccharide biosynthesis C-terminal domain-containing protein [Candidatus Saccharibacteria bacterium]|nr:polysaccharide biosynthesis C-terminal domain-containing protein [Candidatus Saccharibacteria bacterium]